MSRAELVEAYLRGDISRRVFIRGLVASGISLAAALAYAEMGSGPTALTTAAAQSFYESSCKVAYKGQINAGNSDIAMFSGKASGVYQGSASGQEFYTDSGPNFPMTFSSTQVTELDCTSALTSTGKEAFIFGTGTATTPATGTNTYNFKITLGDGTTSGKADTYQLQLYTSAGVFYDSGLQTLTSGAVRIH